MMSFLEVESYVQGSLQNYVSQCQICFACSLISGPESAQLIDRAQDDEPSNYAPGREGPLAWTIVQAPLILMDMTPINTNGHDTHEY